MAGCLSVTIDVEDWYHIPSVTGSPFSVYRDVDHFFRSWGDRRYDYLSGPLGRALDLLDEFGIKATFFVVADVVGHYPGLVESIADRGHEIACHGLHHTCKIHNRTKSPLVDIESFKRRTLAAREMLEGACKNRVIGYRAPNALVAGWMLDALDELGYRYDSSVCVNSLYNKTDSELKGVSTSPYSPGRCSLEPGERGRFTEFPWASYDIGVKLPTSGGPMLRFLGAHVVLGGLRQSLRRGHAIFYFHPLDISEEPFPRIGKGRPFYWSIKGRTVEQRVRLILQSLSDEGVRMKSLGALHQEAVA